MGNNTSIQTQRTDRIKNYIKSKRNKRTRTRNNNNDKFLLKYYNLTNNKSNILNDISLMDQRRAVFISLHGLFLTWKNVPSFMMYTAILLMPLKKEWIYNPIKYKKEFSEHFTSQCSIFNDTNDINEFIELLKWKDKQELVFWMLDTVKNDKDSTNTRLVDPFWISFSNKLTTLYDPVNKCKYSSIKFDPDEYRVNYISKYDIKLSSVLCELYFIQMKYKSISEIIYQSNPTSLLPMISYNKYDTPKEIIWINNNDIKNDCISESDIDDNTDLYICTDYDPYDISDCNDNDINIC